MRRFGGFAGLVVACVLVLGCAGSGFQYVSNDDEQLFLRIPEEWSVLDNADYTDHVASGDGVSSLDATVVEQQRLWVTAFSEGAVTFDEAFEPTGEVPAGYVMVLSLDAVEREAVSLDSLRSIGWPADADGTTIDPVQVTRDAPDARVRVLEYDSGVRIGRADGVRTRAEFDLAGGPVTREVTAVVDEQTTRLFVLVTGCSVGCFEAHEDQLDDVTESFTLEELE